MAMVLGVFARSAGGSYAGGTALAAVSGEPGGLVVDVVGLVFDN
jgi:hypothetical protein